MNTDEYWFHVLYNLWAQLFTYIILYFIFRKILAGEELAYDYKFPIEDVKIKCFCGAKRCKKYMNWHKPTTKLE